MIHTDCERIHGLLRSDNLRRYMSVNQYSVLSVMQYKFTMSKSNTVNNAKDAQYIDKTDKINICFKSW